MGVYLFILAFLILFYLIGDSKNYIILLAFVAVVFVLLSAFRAESVGIDHLSYKRGFEYDLRFYSFWDHLFKWDVGWLILNYSMMLLYDNWHSMLILIAILTVYPMYYIFKKYTPDPVLAMLIYYLLYGFILSFSLIKQSVAISLIILSLFFLANGKKIKSFFSAVFGFMVHYSAFFLLPIVIVSKRFVVKRSFVVPVLLTTFIIGFFSSQNSIITNLISLLPFEKYAHYSDYNADAVVNPLNTYLFLLPKNILCILIFYRLKGREYSIFKNIYFFNLVVANLFFISIPLISRFVLYGFQLESVLLVYYVYHFSGKNRRFAKIGVTLYASTYFVYNLLTNRGGVIPYEFDFSIFI